MVLSACLAGCKEEPSTPPPPDLPGELRSEAAQYRHHQLQVQRLRREVANALKERNPKRQLAVLDRILVSEPFQPQCQAQRVRVLLQLGQTRIARETLDKLLWPRPGLPAVLAQDPELVETALELAESAGDRMAINRTFELAEDLFASPPQYSPGHSVSRFNEVCGILAFEASQSAQRRGDLCASRRLLMRAIFRGGSVDLYWTHLARLDREVGRQAFQVGDFVSGTQAWQACLLAATHSQEACTRNLSNHELQSTFKSVNID